MPSKLKQNTWIITLSLAALAIVYVKFLWLPGHRANSAMCQEVEEKRAFVTQSAGLAAGLVATHKELQESKALVEQWEKTAPGKRDIPALYAKIDALAKDAHLTIEKLDPQPIVLRQKLQEIPININCVGSFSQIYEFLRTLEGLPVAMWIESLRLDRKSQDTQDVQCELSVVVFSVNS